MLGAFARGACLNPYSNGMLTQITNTTSKNPKHYTSVLILILMECLLSSQRNNPLRLSAFCLNPYSNGMLTQYRWIQLITIIASLNPYSNGMLTQVNGVELSKKQVSLNPYSNGMLTQVSLPLLMPTGRRVLILILMECLLSGRRRC